MPEPLNNPEKFVNCKYYEISQTENLKACNDKRSFPSFHLNARSLSNNFDNF